VPRIGHGYFSAEKFRDPASHRRSPALHPAPQDEARISQISY